MADGTLDGYIAGHVDGEGSFSASIPAEWQLSRRTQLVPEFHLALSMNGEGRFRKVKWNEIAEEVSR